jgi:hypothetical protein
MGWRGDSPSALELLANGGDSPSSVKLLDSEMEEIVRLQWSY